MQFSLTLVKEYQQEMLVSYSIVIQAEDAQTELQSLVHALFGHYAGAGAGTKPRCAGIPEVGGSITPTSVHLDKTHEN